MACSDKDEDRREATGGGRLRDTELINALLFAWHRPSGYYYCAVVLMVCFFFTSSPAEVRWVQVQFTRMNYDVARTASLTKRE